ncbi:MAG: glycosyltransferase family 117 protein [Gemmatimonadaceae bacterium]
MATTASISSRKEYESSQNEYEPSYIPAAIAAALVFILYLLTLAPSVEMWDTGEYMAAVKVLGIPHPPGNPFFVLLGHAFALLPIPVSYAARVNIMAALASACSAGFWFLITERIVARWIFERWQRLVVASLATLVGATAFTVWNQSVVNEKVYTISLLFFTIVSWIIIEWIEEPDSRRADRLVVLVCFLLGLGYSVHPAGFLPLPAAGVALLATRWRTLLRWKLVLAGIGALILGLTPFIYEPVRAAYFPPINEGAPTACSVKLEASCTFDKLTLERLRANINREQYGQKVERGATYPEQVGMWWLYFKWQWLRDAHGTMPGAQFVIAFLFLALGLLGGYVHWDRDRRTFWYFGPLMFTMTLALIYYLNFKYGWSQDPGATDVQREVRDRDYFFIWSFSAWGVWAAIGLSFLWEQLAHVIGGEERAKTQIRQTPGASGQGVKKAAAVPAWPSRRSFMRAAPILLIALIPLFANWKFASRAGHHFTQQWARDYLNSLEPYAIVITNGDNDTFPLWYAQEVEGVRRDVTVAVTTYLDTDWFVRQMVRRPVETYDAAKGPAIYRNQQWKKPVGPPLKMTFAEADAIPEYIQLSEPQVFRHGDITLNIPPGILVRDQLVLLRLIKDSYPERPIYVSTGGGQNLGLTPYLLSQGFVQKLVDHPITESAATPKIGGLFLDVDRSKALWDSVYHAPEALIKEGDWIDRASFGIAYTYAFTGTILAEAMRERADPVSANAILDRVKAIVKAARISGFEGT